MAKLILNDELIKIAYEQLKMGVPQKYVAHALGVAETAWYDWIKRGERGDNEILVKFYESVKRAKAEAVKRNVMLIQKAAVNNWQAAAWWLERTHPKEFGRKDKMNLETPDGIKIEIVDKRK